MLKTRQIRVKYLTIRCIVMRKKLCTDRLTLQISTFLHQDHSFWYYTFERGKHDYQLLLNSIVVGKKNKRKCRRFALFIMLLSSNFLRKFFHREKLRTFKFFVPHTNLNLANLKKRRPNIEFYKYIVVCVYCALHFSKRDEPNIRTRCRWKWMAPFY